MFFFFFFGALRSFHCSVVFVIRLLSRLSIRFCSEYMQKGRPVIIRGFVSTWPAMGDARRQWNDLEYLRRVAGFRTVPIEIGSKYTETQWSQTLMTLNDFLDYFITKEKEPPNPLWKDQIGFACNLFRFFFWFFLVNKPFLVLVLNWVYSYLAQTELFQQIQTLKRDFVVPDYTTLSLSSEADDETNVKVNAWFGPGGTVSPLHHDPYHNLFCQVVGSKCIQQKLGFFVFLTLGMVLLDLHFADIRLYDSSYQQELYPFSKNESVLDNTSQVDLENKFDESRFPLFKTANYQECVVHPGDMLYVPPKWWHFVKSLSTSFSVSFWWD